MGARAGGGYANGDAGLLTRLAASVKQLLRWRPGRYESAEETSPGSGDGAGFVIAQPEPEHLHHARYSVQELDAAIEDSIRTGAADLNAAGRGSDSGDAVGKSWWGRMRSSRSRPKPAEPPARETKAFGGDLYPTAAHGTGKDVRYVKVSTWSKQSPNGAPKPSGDATHA